MRFGTLALILAIGCGGGGEEGSDTDDTTTPTNGDCTDPDFNPFSGTCVETFLAGCFDPEGTCEGEIDALGNTHLEWENGATVQSELGSGGGFTPVVLTEILSSSGAVCAEGVSENNADGCASRTVYTRPDGATQTWCFGQDGSYVVTCDDGTSIDVPSSQSAAAEQCQYGSEAGACDIDTSGIGQ